MIQPARALGRQNALLEHVLSQPVCHVTVHKNSVYTLQEKSADSVAHKHCHFHACLKHNESMC
jgi:hypothetical protein